MNLLDLLYGNFGWILFSFVCFVFYGICMLVEKYGVAAFGTLIILAVLYKMTNVFGWILMHKALTVGLFFGYFLIIGAPYALFEWWLLVRCVLEKNREEKIEWLNLNSFQAFDNDEEQEIWKRSQGKMTEELLPLWNKKAQRTTFYYWFGRECSITKPHPKEYKDFIMVCIVFWPLLLTWRLLHDPIRSMGRFVYNFILSSLNNIVNYVWKDENEI